jgi:hypothetical protein
VDVTGFKLGIYDFLGLVVPGLSVVCEAWIALRGWPRFAAGVGELHPVSVTLFVVASFIVGHFVQELADWGVKRIRGDRFLKRGRDSVWEKGDAEAIKSAIWSESGLALSHVDPAFDYCLTRCGNAFLKRDIFVATSDFARSFLVLTVCGVAPAFRLSLDETHSMLGFFAVLGTYLVVLTLVACLAWRRMIRFRRLSDAGVFAAYLGFRPALDAREGERSRRP